MYFSLYFVIIKPFSSHWNTSLQDCFKYFINHGVHCIKYYLTRETKYFLFPFVQWLFGPRSLQENKIFWEKILRNLKVMLLLILHCYSLMTLYLITVLWLIRFPYWIIKTTLTFPSLRTVFFKVFTVLLATAWI